jgi:hypothetical protein
LRWARGVDRVSVSRPASMASSGAAPAASCFCVTAQRPAAPPPPSIRVAGDVLSPPEGPPRNPEAARVTAEDGGTSTRGIPARCPGRCSTGRSLVLRPVQGRTTQALPARAGRSCFCVTHPPCRRGLGPVSRHPGLDQACSLQLASPQSPGTTATTTEIAVFDCSGSVLPRLSIVFLCHASIPFQ